MASRHRNSSSFPFLFLALLAFQAKIFQGCRERVPKFGDGHLVDPISWTLVVALSPSSCSARLFRFVHRKRFGEPKPWTRFPCCRMLTWIALVVYLCSWRWSWFLCCCGFSNTGVGESWLCFPRNLPLLGFMEAFPITFRMLPLEDSACFRGATVPLVVSQRKALLTLNAFGGGMTSISYVSKLLLIEALSFSCFRFQGFYPDAQVHNALMSKMRYS